MSWTPERLSNLAFRKLGDLNHSVYNDRITVTMPYTANSVDVIPKKYHTGDGKERCEVDARLEFIVPSKNPTYSWFLENYLEIHDFTDEALDTGSNLYYTELYDHYAPRSMKRFCHVDEVHVHTGIGPRRESKEHVHVKCRDDIPCGLAIDVAKDLIEATQTISGEQYNVPEAVVTRLEAHLEDV